MKTRKIFALLLCISILIGCVMLCPSASGDKIVKVGSSGTVVIPLVEYSTAKDNSGSGVQENVDLFVYSGNNGEEFYDGVRKGDSFEVSVDVEVAGKYIISMGIAWPSSKPQFTLSIDGGKPIAMNNENYGKDYRTWFSSTSITVELSKGKHTLLATQTGLATCLYSINLTHSSKRELAIYPGMEDIGSGAKIFSLPTDKVSVIPLIEYSTARDNSTNVEANVDMYTEYGNYNEMFYDGVRNGDSFEVLLYVERAGSYNIAMGIAWPDAAPQFKFSIDGGNDIPVKNTKGGTDYRKWFDTDILTVDLSAGVHTVKATQTGLAACVYSMNVAPANIEFVSKYPSFDHIVDENEGLVPASVEDGAIGLRLMLNADFGALSCRMISNASDSGSCSFSLYKWNTTYEKTLATEPLFTIKKENIVDGETLSFAFDEQGAGEYLFLIHDGDMCGVWMDPAPQNPRGFLYAEGEELLAEIDMTVYPSGEVTGDFYGKCEPSPIDPTEDTSTADTSVEGTSAADTTEADITAPDTTFEDTTAENLTMADTIADGEDVTASASETTVAPTDTAEALVPDTAVAPTDENTDSFADSTAAETSGGCGSVVASALAVAIIAAAGVTAVLKKKED